MTGRDLFSKLSESSPRFNSLRQQLQHLTRSAQIAALKSGTEVEDMSFEEIAVLRQLSKEIVPLVIKIGGPEARQDIRNCIKHDVDMILAPMVETVYALTNFVETAVSIIEEKESNHIQLAFNLESKTAYSNLDAMIQSRAFAMLSQVTIGRGDLSKSMHLAVDDDEVTRVTISALKRLSRNRVTTSVGGGLTVKNIPSMAATLPSDRFNTRHIVLHNNKKFQTNPAQSLFNGLAFEKDLYLLLAELFQDRSNYYQKRALVLEQRMGNIKVLTGKKSG